jgi:hypothetical protein
MSDPRRGLGGLERGGHKYYRELVRYSHFIPRFAQIIQTVRPYQAEESGLARSPDKGSYP